MTDAVGIPVWDSVHGAPRGVSVRVAQWKDATLNPRRLRAPLPPSGSVERASTSVSPLFTGTQGAGPCGSHIFHWRGGEIRRWVRRWVGGGGGGRNRSSGNEKCRGPKAA
ncbi:hypothetical protein BHE74_00002543 [Ensete ventricosum]|nr:hypothetical protein BHE74_00002543 [Ensete ventricosum]